MRALISNRSLFNRLFNAARNKTSGGQGGIVQHVPVPAISPDEILVKVQAVLNPTNFKHLDVISPPGSIIGCDYAGVVHRVGEAAKDKWKVGDRVAGVVHGGLYQDRGSFADFLKIDADLAWKIPDDMNDTDATTFGVSVVTAMLSLNVRHGLPFVDGTVKEPHKEAVLIYAGSTSAGLFHIQIAKAAGYTVFTTASPRSFDLVKRYGATAVYDYKSPDVSKEIIKQYPGISKAVDCFSEGNSTSVCAEVLGQNGGKVVTLLPNGKSHIPGVTYELVMAYTLFGRAFQWLPPVGPKFAASPEDCEALERFYEVLPQVTHIVKPIPTIKLQDGFDGILEGLNRLREGGVVGGKQVVRFN